MPNLPDEFGPTESIVRPSTDHDLIGRYRLIQKIGEGGMGEVWLAEQTEPVRRRVALKLIKRGMDGREVIARFESERQALALMDHPAISKVLDAGSAEDGRPYFVMQYIPGLPITRYCDKHRLTNADRLHLFTLACEGVQHAHQKAVIHRDLKPSNILVTDVDGTPMPVIIDFGIAKATARGLTDQSLLTRVGTLIGTPEYMSPEQADSGGEDIDTRTDVYSLGVVLYELLTGMLPFDRKQFESSALHEVLRMLREQDPLRPSARFKTLGPDAVSQAVNRRTDPVNLLRQLRGDLDSIVMKALEKDRARRYGSPSELADDIRRYRTYQPVRARPPSFRYRFDKFVRRNRIAVSAVTAVLLMLIVLVVAMAVQGLRITRERDRANREAEASKRVVEFMTSMFKVSSPGEARGNTVTAREILDKASKDLSSTVGSEAWNSRDLKSRPH